MNQYEPTLRQRLIARNDRPKEPEPLAVPTAGVIDAPTVDALQQLATLARDGDTAARDRLYFSLQPRLHRIGYVLRPWPNTSVLTGLWDRDDVDQECWLIYMDILRAWNGDTSFVTYLLARFGWRLRDRILRGIGKPSVPGGTTRVPDDVLSGLLTARDVDQPESALVATKLLEHLLNQRMGKGAETANIRDVLAALRSPLRPGEVLSTSLPDDGHPFSQIEVA